VVVRVHHDALGAHAGAGHPSRRYPYPYVPIEAPGPTSGVERTHRWGHIPALRRVDGLCPPSSVRVVRARRFSFLSYSSPSCGTGGSDSTFFPASSDHTFDWWALAHQP
jgi:hypothetical protein